MTSHISAYVSCLVIEPGLAEQLYFINSFELPLVQLVKLSLSCWRPCHMVKAMACAWEAGRYGGVAPIILVPQHPQRGISPVLRRGAAVHARHDSCLSVLESRLLVHAWS